MKVSKAQLHEDLQPYFVKLSLVAFLHKKRWFRRFFIWIMTKKLHGKDVNGLSCEERFIPTSDSNWRLRIRIYRPERPGAEPLPAMLYFHPGGYLFGCPEMSDDFIKQMISRKPCIVIAPDYRKSHTKPFPAGFTDCYDTLLWVRDNADNLGVNADKFIVAGHSAGGGLAAAVTLKARDTQDVQVAFQMPFYPMIDDLQPYDPARQIDSPVWDTELNQFGWNAYLADLHTSGADIPSYAAPARCSDFRNLPPTITFVGNLEPFHQETLSYVNALQKESIETMFEEFDGCYHAFDMLAPDAGVSQDARRFMLDSYSEFYDRYLATNPSMSGA